MSAIKRLVRVKPVFFLCDIQERFRLTIHNFPAVVHTADNLLKAAEILDIPLIVTEQYPKALGNIVKELSIQRAALIDQKTKFSMWTESVQKVTREQLKADSVVLFGIESHVCVLQTALDLRENGLNVFVVADGVSSGNREEIPIALERMRSSGCVITTSDSLLFELMMDAKADKFKDISALVKESMKSPLHNSLLGTNKL